MARRGPSRQHGWCAALLAVLTLLAMASPVVAQATHEIAPLGTDPARNVDRYQVTIGPGGSLWDIGFNRLPLIALEQGEQRVVELVEQAFRAQYPERGPNEVRVGDSFVLEVQTGTFVARTVERQPDRVVFE